MTTYDGLVWTDAPDPKHVHPPIAACIKAGHTTNGVECMYGFCGRCSGHVDNGHQGHYWKFCQVTKSLRDFHFCCPDSCELEATPDAA